MRNRIVLVVVAVLTIIGLTATAAQAADAFRPTQRSGTIVNSVYSDINIQISNQPTPTQSSMMNLPIGKGSFSYWNFQDVDGFWVYGGCYAQNVQTGYKYWGYSGSPKYYPLPDGAYLGLNHQCW